ncbi:MAG: TrmH family RNA methyltransferase [Puniceicoccaceae bacterium]
MDRFLEPIRSPSNPRVREWVRLHEGKRRRESGRFLIDGSYEVRQALEGGLALEEILIGDDPAGDGLAEEWTRTGAESAVPLRRVAPRVLAKVSVRRHPDGVVAVARRPDRGLRLPGDPEGPLLVVSRLEKPGNLGALVRSAYAAGSAGILLCDPAVDFEHPQVIRASRGLVFRLPGWTAGSAEAIDFLAARGIAVVAADKEAPVDLWEADWPEPAAIVLGEEHAGLAPGWARAAACGVRIPMRQGIDSLNVSVSGALLLYEWHRRHRSG